MKWDKDTVREYVEKEIEKSEIKTNREYQMGKLSGMATVFSYLGVITYEESIDLVVDMLSDKFQEWES